MHSDLEALFSMRTYDLKVWANGKIPNHYKRLSIDMKKAEEYAIEGYSKVWGYFGVKLYFTQALIAGAILSGDFAYLTIVTPSQYGKSWLMGMIADIVAYKGEKVYVAGGTGDGSDIIMDYALSHLGDATEEITSELLNKKTEIERVRTSLSKTKIAFKNGGHVEAKSLGDTYKGLIGNKLIGRGGNYIIDEAANITGETLSELGRSEFAKRDGRSYWTCMISNPHQPGEFWDDLTQDNPPDNHLIIWMDALTAVEEEVWTVERVASSKFAKRKDTRDRYLLCVLPEAGEAFIQPPKVIEKYDPTGYETHFLGVDAAYTGADDISVAHLMATEDNNFICDGIHAMEKGDWVLGETSERIIDDIAKIARYYAVGMVCVDTGQGIWIAEGLANRGIPVRQVNFGSAPNKIRAKKQHYAATNANNKRAELHLDVQSLTEEGRLYVTEDVMEQIKPTLPLITAKRLTNGKILIRPKPEIKSMLGNSPDSFDALMLAIQAMIIYLE